MTPGRSNLGARGAVTALDYAASRVGPNFGAQPLVIRWSPANTTAGGSASQAPVLASFVSSASSDTLFNVVTIDHGGTVRHPPPVLVTEAGTLTGLGPRKRLLWTMLVQAQENKAVERRQVLVRRSLVLVPGDEVVHYYDLLVDVRPVVA